MTDAHCHLNHEQFAGDLAEALQRARSAGVRRMVCIGYDLRSSERAIELATSSDDVWATVGIHPHDARDYSLDVERRLREIATHERVVAIGEIGLDYHYDFSPRAAQLEAFVAQLGLAKELAMPVAVHCREAHDDLLGILEGQSDMTCGVMHCWSGSVDEARRYVGLGLHLGIGGVVTFKKSDDLREVVRSAPPERLVLETDAPYLAPVPYRGRRNEPGYLQYVADAVGLALDMSAADVAALTDGNALSLYPRLAG